MQSGISSISTSVNETSSAISSNLASSYVLKKSSDGSCSSRSGQMAIDQWVKKVSISIPRYNFGMESVNGKIYAIGGSGDGVLNSVEEYDTRINR